jgi:ribosomal protein L11 methyltransferase
MPKPISSFCLMIIIPAEYSDLAYTAMFKFAGLGCEELAIADTIKFNFYFTDEKTALAAAESITSQITIPEFSIEKVENQDWNAKWRESMKPARIARGWYVSPVWLPPPESARHWIKIEPKMAFGTGHHETTRLASQAIIAEKHLIKNKNVLDIGSGSGVLCFVADRCGAKSCIGVELDECCRENMAENLRENVPLGQIGFIMGSTNALNKTQRFSLVVMNMIIAESSPLLDKIASLLEPEGRFIWSGILKDEYKEAVTIAERAGFTLKSEKRENEWWCGVFILTDKQLDFS